MKEKFCLFKLTNQIRTLGCPKNQLVRCLSLQICIMGLKQMVQ